MTQVEQITAKRAGTGPRGCDPEQAYPGYTLFTPLNASRTAYVIDLAGEVAQEGETWQR